MIASFDGACEPYNPGGHMGLGWVIDGQPYFEHIPAGSENTNNVAEYLALTRVLRRAIIAGPPSLTITGDSQLIIFQVNGEYSMRSRSLERHYMAALSLLDRIRRSGCTVCLMRVPRDQNVAADKASHDALTEHGVESPRRVPDPGWTPRLGDIAEELYLSAVKLGRLLEELGVRKDREPTEDALADGYAQRRFNGFGMSIDWHAQKVLDLVRLSTHYSAIRITQGLPVSKKEQTDQVVFIRGPA
jgi:ribonuclease HI